jgi:hypothetical protein
MNLSNKFKNKIYKVYNFLGTLKKILNLFFLNDEYIFTKFYKKNKWGGSESKSGEGSSKRNTLSTRKIIPRVIKKYSIKTFFDAPCGDFNWMKLVNFDDCKYIGGDIVNLIISNNNKEFSNNKRQFINFNIITHIPPKVDLIFCRDALIHLSNRATLQVLSNFQKSGSKFLLTTHFPNEKKNIFIVNGMFRRINLEISPFNLPAPIEIFLEDQIDQSLEKKFLALWDLTKIKSRSL